MDGFERRIASLLQPDTTARPLTDESVREAEAKLGVRLPADLLALLRVQNGGYTRDEYRVCPTSRPTSWADDHVMVDEIMGTATRESTAVSLLDSPRLDEEWQQPPELVLLCGDGHWWIALDYRECGPDGEPPVIFYENDSEGSPDELLLAPSFREFVCKLQPEPEFDGGPTGISGWTDPEFAAAQGVAPPREQQPRRWWQRRGG